MTKIHVTPLERSWSSYVYIYIPFKPECTLTLRLRLFRRGSDLKGFHVYTKFEWQPKNGKILYVKHER